MELRGERAEGELYFCKDDAIFALATVPGKSAIGVFRCSGLKVWHFFQQTFSRYHSLLQAESHTATYGFLHHPQTKELLDEVLLLKFCAPRSYSGEDMVEVHCHGSIAVLNALHSLLLLIGLREAERGEFTYRSIKYGKRSIHQAEAIVLLTNSNSQNQRRNALEQFHSPMLQKLQQIRVELLQVLARSELQLDYDETELEFYYQLPDSLPLARASLEYLENCLASYRLRRSYWQEWKIVLIGATNSGKSSLFNSLLLRERSIVSEQAGTTRDYLEAYLELDGQSILLYDTAGLRSDSEDLIEQKGIERTWQLLEQADCVLLLSDIRVVQQEELNSTFLGQEPAKQDELNELRELPELRAELRDSLLQRKKLLIEVWNKCDLLDNVAIQQLKQFAPSTHPVIFCSVKDSQGLPQLLSKLESLLPHSQGTQGGAGIANPETKIEAPVNEHQADLLHQAAKLLEEYCDGLQNSELFELDWASELLRQICGRLGEISGEACNTKMLRDIFQQFCVGK